MDNSDIKKLVDDESLKKLVDESVKNYMDNLKEDLIFRLAEIIETDMIEKQKGLQSPYIKVIEEKPVEKEEDKTEVEKEKDLII